MIAGPSVTLLHVVGESDTGLLTDSSRTEQDRGHRARDWCSALDAADSLDATAAILRGGWSGDLGTFRSTPLAGLLGAMADDGSSAVELVLVSGPDTGRGVPTDGIARSLARALERCPTALGIPVSGITVLTAAGFDDDSAAGEVCAHLETGGPDVVMSWGSGSTGLAMSALAGLVESGRRWTLRESRGSFEVLALLPSEPVNALVPWLLRLGYVETMLELDDRNRLRPPASEAQLRRARAAAASQRAVAGGSQDVHDLAGWVRSDLRRRDGTSAIAVRAWVEARYRAERGEHDPWSIDLLDHVATVRRREGAAPPTLAVIARYVEELRLKSPEVARAADSGSGRWLLAAIRAVNPSASVAAHSFAPPDPAVIEFVHQWLPAEPPDGLPVLGPSTGTVAMIWPAGVRGPRPSPARTVLDSALDERILSLTGRVTPSAVSMTCAIVATTPESAAFAHEQVAELAASPTGLRSVEGTVLLADGSTEATQDAVTRHLAGQTPEPDVVVFLPVGPKPAVAATFAAAVEYGQTRAVPVLVECTDLDRTAVTYHRIASYLGVDHVLVALAQRAVRRLEFDTAARLLGVGSTALEAAGERASALAQAVRAAVARVPDTGRNAATADLMDLFVNAWGEAEDKSALLRLVHLAGTVAPRRSPLRRMRNALPTSHGERALRALDTPAKIKDEILRERKEAGPRVTDLNRRDRALLGELEQIEREAVHDFQITGSAARGLTTTRSRP